jgi:iron complex transport system substrate-binding protein
MIRHAGGENVFADIADDWTHVSWEEAAARTPDVIVVNAYDMDGQGDVADKTAALRKIPAWRDVPVVVLPLGEAMGGLRSFDGLERLRAAFAGAGR